MRNIIRPPIAFATTIRSCDNNRLVCFSLAFAYRCAPLPHEPKTFNHFSRRWYCYLKFDKKRKFTFRTFDAYVYLPLQVGRFLLTFDNCEFNLVRHFKAL